MEGASKYQRVPPPTKLTAFHEPLQTALLADARRTKHERRTALALYAEIKVLGYGGGYYDRTLAALPGCRTIGCAYDAQRVPEVPAAPYDVPLDAVATEEGVTWFRR